MTDKQQFAPSRRLWLWKNFVDGKPEYWAFDNACPTHGGGDPMTLGEPCGYALYKESTPRRIDPPEAEIIAAIQRSTPRSAIERTIPEAYLRAIRDLLKMSERQGATGVTIGEFDHAALEAALLALAAAPAAPQQEPEYVAEFRRALRFYARGMHTIGLEDCAWELEEGWLCPPSIEGEDDQSIMVEPGSVAKAVLMGAPNMEWEGDENTPLEKEIPAPQAAVPEATPTVRDLVPEELLSIRGLATQLGVTDDKADSIYRTVRLEIFADADKRTDMNSGDAS